ncbi:peroxisomal ATPase PEX6 isoform X2 [Rhipicephalus microplus]|uniref:peroxisomal ATPase PEX6 isoform X2 n=1 Tax=Rhipicephalus microplus TaxID=6941 RepID=UPI003F6A69E9
MKRVRTKLRLLPDSASSGSCDSNGLHVRISRNVADELSLGDGTTDGTLALVAPENVSLTYPGLFVNYEVVDDREVPSLSYSGTNVALFVTRDFLKRRRGWEDGQAVDVLCGVRCPRLTKVSLLARSPDAYAKLNSADLWEVLGGGAGRDGVLCRMDDSLAAFGGDTVLVVDCEPTRQGLIVAETQVVVIRPPLEYTPAGDGAPCDDVVKLAGTILYTSRILQSTHRAKQDRSVAAGIAASVRRRTPGFLRVHILPQLPEHEIPTTADPLNCVFLSQSTMASLGLSEGSWAQAWLVEQGGRGSPSSEPQLKRLVAIWKVERLHVMESELASGITQQDAAFLSPHLWFHLHDRDKPALLVRPTARLHLEALEGSTSKGSPPASAQEFNLAIVRSPLYSHTIECTALLKEHFSRPRYICNGDIVTINLRGSPCYEEYLPDGSSQRNHVVFFKATQLLGPDNGGPGYFCDTNTRLYQAGTKGCYVPAAMAGYHRSWAPHPVWDAPQPPHLAPIVERLQSILLPFLQSGSLRERVAPCVLLSGSRGSGKCTALTALTRSLGLHHYQVNCQQLLGDTAAAAETRIRHALMKAQLYTPCLLQLSNVEVFSVDRDVGSGGDPRVVRCLGDTLRALNGELDEPPVAVVATTAADPDTLHPDLAPLFLHSIEIPYPNEEGRAQLLDALLWSLPKNNSVDISYLAQRTAGFNLGDLCALVGQATARAHARLTSSSRGGQQREEGWEAGVCIAGPLLVQADLESALEWLQGSQAQAVGAPRIPCVHWEDVGGLAEAKRTLTDTLQLPLRHPQLLDAGLKRSGVLLYGPPGTGKTLLAKAVATECALSFLSVKGPELINMYVGQSEENVRAVFARARSAAPCVIFFDELDSLAPNRGRSGDSGGVMDRVVSQLLAEMDGLNKSADVFVIGATNRPDLLDPAILRPGRFDQLLYVGIPSDKDSQLKILKALTRKFRFAEGLDLALVVEECPAGLTGADFYSLSSSAMVLATRRHIGQLERGVIPADNHHVVVTLEDFQAALEDLVPSVSPAELARYKDIREKLASPKAVAVTT